MVRDIVQSCLKAVRIDPAALPVVRDTARQWMESAGCIRELARGDANPCLDTQFYLQDLERILADHYVDQLEAPWLVSRLKPAAGQDLTLSLDEAQVFQDNRIVSIPKVAPPLLIDDLENFNKVLPHLEKTSEHIDSLIAACESWLQDELQNAESFFHFLSAENLWGLSSRITADGSPFSDMELNGLKNFLSWLYRMRTGLRVFQSQLQQGRHRFNSRVVQEFLASPFALFAHLSFHFEGEKEEPAGDDEETYYRFLHFERGVIQKAMDGGSQRLAAFLARQYVTRMEAEYPAWRAKNFEGQIFKVLPGSLFRFLDGPFTIFANSVASWDSVALALTGSLAAKVGGGIAAGAKLFLKLNEMPAALRWLIPGNVAFTRGDNFWVNGLKIFANLGLEGVKLSALTTTAYAIGGETAEHWVGGAAMFVGGAVNGLKSAVTANLAGEVLGGKPKLLNLFLKDEATKGELRSLARLFSGEAEQKSFRLAREVDVDALAAGLRKIQIEKNIAELSVRQAQRISERVAGTFRGLEKLVRRNPDVLKEELLARAEEALRLPDSKQALQSLNRLLEEARMEVRRIRLAQSPLPRMDGPKPNPLDSRRGGRRAGGGASRHNGDSPAAAEETSAPKVPNGAGPTRLENIVNHPPEEIRARMVFQLTEGKIVVARGLRQDLENFYRGHPSLRSALWRRLKELAQDEGGDWQKLHGDKGLLRGRIGDFRIIAQREGDRFIIRDIVERSNLTRPRQRF